MTTITHQPTASTGISSVKTTSDKLDAAILLANTFKDENKTIDISSLVSKYYPNRKMEKKS